MGADGFSFGAAYGCARVCRLSETCCGASVCDRKLCEAHAGSIPRDRTKGALEGKSGAFSTCGERGNSSTGNGLCVLFGCGFAHACDDDAGNLIGNPVCNLAGGGIAEIAEAAEILEGGLCGSNFLIGLPFTSAGSSILLCRANGVPPRLGLDIDSVFSIHPFNPLAGQERKLKRVLWSDDRGYPHLRRVAG